MAPAFLIIFIGIVSAMAAIFWMGARNAHKRDVAYKTALEHNQKKLDLQMSRINILSRALTNLQASLNDVKAPDKWQVVALDEARSLLWADGASYWNHLEKDQALEVVLARGLNAASAATRVVLDKNATDDILAQAVTARTAILQSNDEIVSEPHSAIAIPLIVFGVIRGVFHFVRKGDDRFSARELDLMTMFLKQLALVLEHREMISNREKFYLELVQTLAETLDSRDASTQGQTKRARALARGMAEELDMPEQFVYYLEFAALLHDIGKLAIDENLLKKPGKLTPEEFEIVKKHPEIGYKILAPVTMLAPVAPMVLYHQEWFNGKGYPEGLSGEEIPLGARIVAILDAWTAMTSDRPWRAALSIEQSLQEVRKGAGTQFDPKVVEAFVATIEKIGPAILA
jgi:HD-GYP domain-containing protein (c-di-GMP phosphodiesterase class II)